MRVVCAFLSSACGSTMERSGWTCGGDYGPCTLVQNKELEELDLLVRAVSRRQSPSSQSIGLNQILRAETFLECRRCQGGVRALRCFRHGSGACHFRNDRSQATKLPPRSTSTTQNIRAGLVDNGECDDNSTCATIDARDRTGRSSQRTRYSRRCSHRVSPNHY